MEELTKEQPWEKIAEVLKNLGNEEDPRRMHAFLLKEYFKLSLRDQETYYDLLPREETLASQLKEREHPIQESTHGFFILRSVNSQMSNSDDSAPFWRLVGGDGDCEGY